MEKIQSAIAKARAERKTQPPAKAAFHHREYEPDTDNNDAWDRLPLIEPSLRRLRTQRIVTMDRVSEAAAFDKLRTRMLQQMQANNWRRVAITSPGPSSGKSTVALNLAFSLSRQMRSRIILSEMDLRKPSIRKLLRLNTDRDFAEVINGNAPFADHGMRLRANLGLGLLQGPVSGSAELLQNAELGMTLDAMEAEYNPTVMLFDMPPLQVSDDMMAFGDKVDCVLIIAAAERTKMAELEVCERELANVTTVLGVVLNKCRYEAPDSSYNYYG
jgi:Mrp family chromosome partitioning ATPase